MTVKGRCPACGERLSAGGYCRERTCFYTDGATPFIPPTRRPSRLSRLSRLSHWLRRVFR